MDTKSVYVGESGRSAHQRGLDHLNGAHSRDPKNPMVRHGEDFHNMVTGVPPFQMLVTRSFLRPLQRQVAESVSIEGGADDADQMLNSKAEWGGSKIPRITMEVGARVQQEDYRGGDQPKRRIEANHPQRANLPARPSTHQQGGRPEAAPPTSRESQGNLHLTHHPPGSSTIISAGGKALTLDQAKGKKRKKRDDTSTGAVRPSKGKEDTRQEPSSEPASRVRAQEEPAPKRTKVVQPSARNQPASRDIRAFFSSKGLPTDSSGDKVDT